MAQIVPAILPSSPEDLEEKLRLIHGIATDVQIDLVDGTLSPQAAWPFLEGESKPDIVPRIDSSLRESLQHQKVELDLMMRQPLSSIAPFTDAGASRIVLHGDAHTLQEQFSYIAKQYGREPRSLSPLLSVGIALYAHTDHTSLEPLLEHCDFVQFMGIRTIGLQGQPFDPSVIDAIAAFRRTHPSIPVQVDGGVTLENAPALLEQGVCRLIVGSALWLSGNVAETYAAFVALTERYGVFA